MPDSSLQRVRVAVIGGGAAGLMAAIAAAEAWQEDMPGERSRTASLAERTEAAPVVILEKQERVGRKLLATGNGQCNLSHVPTIIWPYHGLVHDFAAAVLQKMNQVAICDYFRKIGLMLRTEPDGRIYPFSRQAAAVVDILRLAASRHGVRTLTAFAAHAIDPDGAGGPFRVLAEDGRSIAADQIVLASGGLAAPSLGADGSGYTLLTRFGHRLVPCFPALVPLRTETSLVHGLAGCKFDGSVSLQAAGYTIETAEGEILFTEYGLSGPPILALSRQVSACCASSPAAPASLLLDMLPDLGAAQLRNWLAFRRDSTPDIELADYLTGLVHKKIGQALLKRCLGRPLNQPVSTLDDPAIARLAASLKSWPLQVLGTRDWHQAQVTAGGLDVRDFQPQDLESRRVPGIFAAGEVLDVDGDFGGFNLQWAWSSGFVAGRQAMRSSLQA